MMFRYDDYSDAEQQLNYTVVMSEEGPVYLRFEDDWDYEVYELQNGDVNNMDIREAGLTFEPLELGYINYHGTLMWLYRTPKRMWKAGLNEDNVTAKGGWVDGAVFKSLGLYNTLMDIYPSMKDAYVESQINNRNVAFHRDFAFLFTYPIAVAYKGDKIGEVTEAGNLKILEEFDYLKEQLEELAA